MPIAKNVFLWTTATLLAAGMLALVAIVGTSWWLVERASDFYQEELLALAGRRATIETRKALQDMEIGQRGFLLTLQESYLEPYNAGKEAAMPAYLRLAEVLKPYPQAEAAMTSLGEAIRQKIGEMEETIALARAGQVEQAIEIVRTDRGKALMDQSRAVLEAILTAADDRIRAGVIAQQNNLLWLRWVSIGGGILIVLLSGAAVWIALKYTREIIESRSELEVLNNALEERVEERTKELVQANEEVQRFAYIVTHDLRAPLVNIMGFTSELDQTMKTVQRYVLADGAPLSEQEIGEARQAASEDLPEAIGFIRSSTRKMDGLINAILKISRDGRRPLVPETLDLTEILQAAADSVQHQVSEADGLIRIDVDAPPVVSDRLSLEQIFGNIIDNAVKYRAAERPIEIDIRARRERGGRVRIDVADNGRGIAEQDHARVFDLFRRAGAQDKPGEGIGLAHVRSLVRNLGGDITLSSRPDVGTTMTVTLPADLRSVPRSSQGVQ
jgi:signal transduction histidine kinase